MANFDLVLWSYVAVLVTVGLVEFSKSRSKASLMASCLLAAPLVLAALGGFGVAESRPAARAVIGCCFALFAYRWWVKKRFMPSGLMALVSLAACGLLSGFAYD